MEQFLTPVDGNLPYGNPLIPKPAPQIALPSEFPTRDEPSTYFQNPWDDAHDDEFCSVGLQESPIYIDDDLTIRLLQAPSGFRGVQHDETGTVLWGASICLARFLSSNAAIVHERTVLELGCGCGLPSLVATCLGAARVIASDMEDGTLQQLDRVAQLNKNICPTTTTTTTLELMKLHWKDNHHSSNNELEVEKVDVILGSDIVYSAQMVAPLVKTIGNFLSDTGKAYVALRTTRQGVNTFWQNAMPEAGFKLMEAIPCQDYMKETDGFPNNEPDHKATGFRFRGDHTIFVFQKQTNV